MLYWMDARRYIADKPHFALQKHTFTNQNLKETVRIVNLINDQT